MLSSGMSGGPTGPPGRANRRCRCRRRVVDKGSSSGAKGTAASATAGGSVWPYPDGSLSSAGGSGTTAVSPSAPSGAASRGVGGGGGPAVSDVPATVPPRPIRVIGIDSPLIKNSNNNNRTASRFRRAVRWERGGWAGGARVTPCAGAAWRKGPPREGYRWGVVYTAPRSLRSVCAAVDPEAVTAISTALCDETRTSLSSML